MVPSLLWNLPQLWVLPRVLQGEGVGFGPRDQEDLFLI